jgi:hypothetical protein
MADPMGYVKTALRQDGYGKQRRKVIFLGSVLCLIVSSLSFSIVLLIQFLKTPEIVGVLDVKNRIPLVAPTFLDLPALKMKERAGGGGGGGRNDPNPPSFGHPPKGELKQPLIPPSTRLPRIKHPAIPMVETIMVQDVLLPKMDQNLPIGDLTSSSLIPSDGPGTCGGIGTGDNGGIGPGEDQGYGPGKKGGTGGGEFKLGGTNRPARTGPQILNNPRPDWTEEARRNRIQGEVWLDVIFAADRQVRIVRVVRGLGYGLDEK